MRSTIAICTGMLPGPLLATVFSPTVRASAHGEDITRWYAACFEGDKVDNVTEVLLCTLNESECFARDSILTIETCVADKVGLLDEPNFTDVLEDLGNITAWIDFAGDVSEYLAGVVTAIGECLEPYVTCLAENVREWIDALPPCVNETLSDWIVCAVDHAEACSQTCSPDDLPEADPFADVDPWALSTCAGVQSEIITPTCRVIDCCEPCVDAFEAAARCVLHEGLSYPETRRFSDDPCIDCDYARENDARLRRQLASPSDVIPGRRMATQQEREQVDTVVGACIDNTPGLTPGAEDAQELVRRGDWFNCITSGMFNAIEETVADADPDAADATTTSPILSDAETSSPTTTTGDTADASSGTSDRSLGVMGTVMTVILPLVSASFFVLMVN